MHEFSEDIIKEAWEKGKIVNGYNPATHRKDACDAWIIREHFGREDTNYGWKIMQKEPFQWENGYNEKGELICKIKSSEFRNIEE